MAELSNISPEMNFLIKSRIYCPKAFFLFFVLCVLFAAITVHPFRLKSHGYYAIIGRAGPIVFVYTIILSVSRIIALRMQILYIFFDFSAIR